MTNTDKYTENEVQLKEKQRRINRLEEEKTFIQEYLKLLQEPPVLASDTELKAQLEADLVRVENRLASFCN